MRDPCLRYSALLVCGFSNLALDRIDDARACRDGFLSVGDDDGDARARAAHMLFVASSCTLFHLRSPYDVDDFYPVAARLPEGLRLFSSYVMAHRFYLRGQYGRCVGAAENALAMRQGSYPVAELFLRIVASMGCMGLKETDRARSHFLAGWQVARPDGLIGPIGMHHGLLQGLIETCLRSECPDEFARIIRLTYRFSYGWRRIHNSESGESVADNLTSTEFTISMLACRGWTNAEIAGYMGVSAGTVKNRLSSVYSKLGISSRAELADHMLR